MICIYHNKDLDGYCSGAIVKKKYPDAIMIGHDYPMKFDINQVPEGEPVIMVDISLPMDQMFALAERTKFQLTWIDHHITALNEYVHLLTINQCGDFLTLISDPTIAACELTWKYLLPGKYLPTAVTLLGKYDTWRNQDPIEWNEAILPFQYGMRQFCNSVESFPQDLFAFYDIITDNPVYRIIRDGNTILQYQKTLNEKHCTKSFLSSFEGYRAVMMNVPFINLIAFESVYDPELHDIVMPFFYDGSKWVFSIYTSKPGIDCGTLAKKYGGGGHTKAAGFHTADPETALLLLNPVQHTIKNS